MNTRFRTIASGAALTLGLTCGAQAAIGLNANWDPRLEVNRVSDTQFEVIEARGAGPADFWCAAGRYAVDTLGRTRGRIYVDTGWGAAQTRAGRRGVIFTTAAPAERVQKYSLSVDTPGFGLLIGAAVQYCRDYIIELEDISP